MRPTSSPCLTVNRLAIGLLLLCVVPSWAQTLYVTNTSTISTSQSFSNGFIGSSNALSSLTGNLSVDSGAVLTVTNSLVMGNVTNTPNNAVTISGAGSELSAGGISVGSGSSRNSLLVTNGAILRSDLSNATSVSVSVGSGTFASSNVLTVTGTGSGWVQTNTNRAVFVGDNGDNNQLIFSGGSVSSIAASINVGVQTAATGNSMLVTGSGTILTNRNILLGGGSNQSLVISGGAQVFSTATGNLQSSPSLSLANTAGSGSPGHTVLVTDPGTVYSLAGGINVGYQGSSSMVVSNGAKLLKSGGSAGVFVGYNAAANGSSLLVTGSGTVFSNAAPLTVGTLSTNSSFTLLDGATYLGSGGGTSLGDNTNGMAASLTINASTFTEGGSGSFSVGREGNTNRLLVTNGGTLNLSNLFFYVGLGGVAIKTADNEAVVTGAGSSLNQAAIASSGNRIGSAGSNNRLIVSNGATAVMGGTAAGAGTQIGSLTNSSANYLLVTDAGSVWGGRGELDIGVRGASNFVSVLNGGLITNGTVRIGMSNEATGNYLLVNGAGSMFSNRVSTTVGNGTNTGNRINVTNGGVLHTGGLLNVQSNSTASAAGSVWVGQGRPSVQTVNVLHTNANSNSVLTVNGSVAAEGTVTIGTRGVLGGAGTVQANTVVTNGGTLSPGNSPGTLTVDGDLTWLGGGNYNWQIHNATGLAGTGWDYLSVTGTLDLTALNSTSKFNINLWSLSAVSPDANGAAINFDNTLDGQSWDILVAAGGITGFDAADFNIRTNSTNGTGGFANALAPGGFFGIQQQGNVISLTYTVPEPSTYALLVLAAAGLGAHVIRRRRTCKG